MKTPFPKVSGVTPEIRTTKKTLSSLHRDKSVQLLRYHPIWRKSPAPFAYHHMRPTDNGQGSRRILLLPKERFGTALAGPLGISCAAVLPPATALWVHLEILTLPAQRFSFLLSYSCPSGLSSPRKHFLPFFAGNRAGWPAASHPPGSKRFRRFWPP